MKMRRPFSWQHAKTSCSNHQKWKKHFSIKLWTASPFVILSQYYYADLYWSAAEQANYSHVNITEYYFDQLPYISSAFSCWENDWLICRASLPSVILCFITHSFVCFSKRVLMLASLLSVSMILIYWMILNWHLVVTEKFWAFLLTWYGSQSNEMCFNIASIFKRSSSTCVSLLYHLTGGCLYIDLQNMFSN